MNNDDNRIQCPNCNSALDRTFLIGKQGHADSCPMCGASLEEDRSDWITWWYYKDTEFNDYSLWDEDNPPRNTEGFELVQEFKAPPRDASGSSLEAKEILRHYCPDAFGHCF